jgi:hypothetical protein
MIACLLECLLKVDTRCNVKSWQAVKIRYPLQARGSGRRSVRECQDGRNPSPKLKSMRARHVTTNPHPRPTLPCLQTSAKSAVFCIARLSGWTGLVASWLTTARSDPYRPPSLAPPALSSPVNATLAGAGYGYGPTSLTGSSFEFDANGRGLYTTL